MLDPAERRPVILTLELIEAFLEIKAWRRLFMVGRPDRWTRGDFDTPFHWSEALRIQIEGAERDGVKPHV